MRWRWLFILTRDSFYIISINNIFTRVMYLFIRLSQEHALMIIKEYASITQHADD